MSNTQTTQIPYPRLYLGDAVTGFLTALREKHPELVDKIHNIGLRVDTGNDDTDETAEDVKEKDYCDTTLNALQEIISRYDDLDFDLQYPVIFNLSFIDNKDTAIQVQTKMLKFIEETHHKVIILSTQDVGMSTFLSRFPYVKKHPRSLKIGSANPQEARKEMAEETIGMFHGSNAYRIEVIKHSWQMCRVNTLCDRSNMGTGMTDRIAYILEHK